MMSFKQRHKVLSYFFLFGMTMLLTACPPEPEYSLTVSETAIYLKARNDNAVITVTGKMGDDPVPWSITMDEKACEFITLSTTSGAGTGQVVISAKQTNDTPDEKSGTLTVSCGNVKQTIRIYQETCWNPDCYAKPMDIMEMAYGMSMYVSVGSECRYYNVGLYEANQANKMSDEELRSDLESNASRSKKISFPNNKKDGKFGIDYTDVIAWYDDIKPNTDYMIVVAAYGSDGTPGIVNKQPASTKSDKYQPTVKLDFKGITDDNYCWKMSMEGYCNSYYTYACVGDAEFESYKREDHGIVAVSKIKKIISKIGKDKYRTNINSEEDGVICREYVYPKCTQNSTLNDFPVNSSDKYLHIIVWGFSSNSESAYSGIVSEAKINLEEYFPKGTNTIGKEDYDDDENVDGKGETYTLDSETSSLSFTSSSGSKSFLITGNDTWTASTDVSWCTLSKSSGTGNSSISVNVTKNSSSYSRSGKITIKGEKSKKTITITISQESGGTNTIGKEDYDDDENVDGKGETYTLDSETSSLSFTSSSGSKSFSITGNDTWTASTNVSWCTLSKSSGTGNSSISANVTKNSSSYSRSGKITIKGEKSKKTITISVSQDAGGSNVIGKNDFE